MDFISPLINWIQSNWGEVVTGYLAIVGLASWIVKLTPTLKDDDVLKNIVRFLGKYIAVNTDKGSSPKV